MIWPTKGLVHGRCHPRGWQPPTAVTCCDPPARLPGASCLAAYCFACRKPPASTSSCRKPRSCCLPLRPLLCNAHRLPWQRRCPAASSTSCRCRWSSMSEAMSAAPAPDDAAVTPATAAPAAAAGAAAEPSSPQTDWSFPVFVGGPRRLSPSDVLFEAGNLERERLAKQVGPAHGWWPLRGRWGRVTAGTRKVACRVSAAGCMVGGPSPLVCSHHVALRWLLPPS